MQRLLKACRRGWQATVEQLGLVFHTPNGQAYWEEGAYYSFTDAEIEAIKNATEELYRLLLLAGQNILDNNLFPRFAIPDFVVPLIKASWEVEPPALNHGRFDLGYDGVNPPKLFEFNCDTPTSLLEAAVIQWQWREECYPMSDQFNSIHERLIQKWGDIAKCFDSPLYFLHALDDVGEDIMTVTYLRDTASQAGIATLPILARDIGWDQRARRFVDMQNNPIDAVFHLYPWEWLVREDFGPHIAECYAQTLWLEPIWKMIWSNKAILVILWDMFPGHPNLLAAFREPHGDNYVRKPMLGREGANVTVVKNGKTVCERTGPYGAEGFVYQDLCPQVTFGDVVPVLGSWVVDGEAAGLGIREGRNITDNASRSLPHIIQ
jgi:glutathionylspermidine synthase